MACQEVECSKPCLEGRNIRKVASSTDKKEREKHQKKALLGAKSQEEVGEKRKRRNLKRQAPDQHWSQRVKMMKMTVMSYPTSGCEEPAPTKYFSPFQDNPHPPIVGNIVKKL